jgi:SanA protein
MRLSFRTVAKAAVLAASLVAVWAVSAYFLVVHGASGKTYSDTASIPERKVGLVLGCSKVLGDGQPNLFFQNRIKAAAELFHSGKVHYLVVSGDNQVQGYDEPQDMKDSLVNAGVPADHIFCDYAGFRTLDSIVRAKAIFSQTSFTVISQKFHNQRAIYIAQHQGLDAIGFNAQDVNAYDSFKTRTREWAARANMLLDIYVTRRSPRFLGPKVTIPT